VSKTTQRAGFAPKDRVTHAVYGLGTIAETNDNYTVIVFDEGGRKKFLTRLVELTPAVEAAPAPRPARKAKKAR
jgi:hypothetical protein